MPFIVQAAKAGIGGALLACCTLGSATPLAAAPAMKQCPVASAALLQTSAGTRDLIGQMQRLSDADLCKFGRATLVPTLAGQVAELAKIRGACPSAHDNKIVDQSWREQTKLAQRMGKAVTAACATGRR